MHILLATGIYPPNLGGTATYAFHLATELQKNGFDVSVLTYGSSDSSFSHNTNNIHYVPCTKFFLFRWLAYARALRSMRKKIDVILALSSVSVGIPLLLARLKTQKKVLRLGGDFFWERYTDAGGTQTLREWYVSKFGFWRMINICFMEAILWSFDAIVYSTKFQQQIHQKEFIGLKSTVIENAEPVVENLPEKKVPQDLYRLLYLGRFVSFKNLSSLIRSLTLLPLASLTLVGDGPEAQNLLTLVQLLKLETRVRFLPPARGKEKENMFAQSDLLVIPSLTEISPNTALEAASCGLPVLLTEETGYTSHPLMLLRPLRTPEQIARAVHESRSYSFPQSTSTTTPRTWGKLGEEWCDFLTQLSV